MSHKNQHHIICGHITETRQWSLEDGPGKKSLVQAQEPSFIPELFQDLQQGAAKFVLIVHRRAKPHES
eukprot:Skav203961  [mRNA]  locus=scaffold94:48127:52211:+ [translate_table: standard]